MILYHGSNSIVRKPDLVEQPRGLDFGSGFYTTTNLDQARRFARIVANRENTEMGFVSCYEIADEVLFENLHILKFETADETWLDFD
jgi:hypothetical protein